MPGDSPTEETGRRVWGARSRGRARAAWTELCRAGILEVCGRHRRTNRMTGRSARHRTGRTLFQKLRQARNRAVSTSHFERLITHRALGRILRTALPRWEITTQTKDGSGPAWRSLKDRPKVNELCLSDIRASRNKAREYLQDDENT